MDNHCSSLKIGKHLKKFGVKCATKKIWLECKHECDHEARLVSCCDVRCDCCCYPALSKKECAYILRKCKHKVSWCGGPSVDESVFIKITGGINAKVKIIRKERSDSDICAMAILYLLICDEIDACYINKCLCELNPECDDCCFCGRKHKHCGHHECCCDECRKCKDHDKDCDKDCDEHCKDECHDHDHHEHHEHHIHIELDEYEEDDEDDDDDE